VQIPDGPATVKVSPTPYHSDSGGRGVKGHDPESGDLPEKRCRILRESGEAQLE